LILTNRPAQPGRRLAAILAAVGILGLAVSGTLMARRVGAFHAASPRVVYAFQPVDERAFTYAGRPVTIEDEPAPPPSADGVASGSPSPYLIVRYGDETLRLRVLIPRRHELPGLKTHEDWMRLLRFAPITGMDMAEFERRLGAGELADRLVIATRAGPAGVDPATWGSVWKRDWVFDFYEFRPDGGFERHERLKYPTTRGVRAPKPGELHENTWQFQAALQLMPQAGSIGPTHNFFGNALAEAGWTLPVAAFSGLLGTVGLAFACAPRRRSQWASAERAP